MSPETRQLLLNLLDQVTLPGNSPTLAEDAQRVVRARAELQQLAGDDGSPSS